MSSAKSIFLQAEEIEDTAERIVYLDKACQGDALLRTEVENLLAAANAAGDFLDGPAFNLDYTTTLFPMAERPGTVIGPYKLVEQIGEGGFGIVFLAIQEQPVRRKIALKVIKPGMDTREVIARFEAERQALALMDHQNIARVFDAGATESGRPYFVMELVRGIPITEYCDQHLLDSRERLELFISVCHAIQHAHQKGIIHRDVKPTNVLVTLHDGRPVVKVIDFGVAKALSQKLTDQTIYTRFAQMLGTPLYMSPEQADMSGQDIDTRSDIYSLGVLLYELLTGTTPFDRQRLKGIAAIELRRILREEEPPKPSTRLSQTGDSLPSIAAMRNTEPAKLSKLVRGELDWIVMKCLDKDRTRRYETANALVRDLERYVNHEPVHACPPTAIYRFRKFARRYRAPLIAASFIMLALICGTAVSTWQAIRASRAEREAIAERDAGELARREAIQGQKEAEKARAEEARARRQAEKVTDLLVRTFQSPHPLREGSEITVAEVLDRAETQLEEELSDEPLTKAALLDAIGRSRISLGTGPGNSGIKTLARAYDIRRQVLGASHADTLTSLDGLASAYRAAGFQEKAIELYEKTLATRRSELGNSHPDTLASLRNLANIYHAVGRRTEALDLYQESLKLAEDKFSTSSGKSKLSEIQAQFILNQGEAQQSREANHLSGQILQHGFFAASAGLASRISAEAVDELMEIAINFHGELTPGALDAVVLGELRLTAGQMEAAGDAFRTALRMGERRPFVYKSLGWCLLAQGQKEAAKENFQKAIEAHRKRDGSYDLSQADPDEMTAAYFLDLISEEEYTNHTAGEQRLACFPWFYVAQRHEIEGNRQAALTAYKQCVDLGENETAHPIRGLARWRLKKLIEEATKVPSPKSTE